MRILMVTEDIPAPQVGGLGKHVVTLSNGLISAGHEVVLMGRSDVDYAANAAEIGFAGRFIGAFRMDRNGWKESQLGVWMPQKRRSLAGRIEAAIAAHAPGFDVVHYHGHLPLTGRGLPASLPLLQTRHDQGSECLTHTRFRHGEVCEERRPAGCAGCATPRPNRLQTAISGFAVQQYRDDVAANFARRHTIFVSEFLRRQFALAVPGADLGRSHVLHNFIDLARVQRLLPEPVNPVPGRVLIAGRIDATKGFRQFLAAWRAGGGGPGLRIVGDGELLEELRRDYAEQAAFTGWMPHERTLEEAARAHVCVVPSVWQEPFGSTILEALVLGRPCVALRRGGAPELQRYERYPGQLRLADTMAEAVALTRAALAEPTRPMAVAQACEADVALALPRLLELYELVRNSSS